jgi:DNA (cytosine-5)-methyltransferase 1
MPHGGLHLVSLCAGIGGIDLGFRRAEIPAVAAVEIDLAARRVLAARFPGTGLFEDLTEVTADDLTAAGAVPERTVLAAGFPCQDLSVAGRRRGMGAGTRSGLYWHIDRLLAEFRPAWVVLENVPGLLSAGCPCPGDASCAITCPGELHAVPGGACDGGCIATHGGAMGAVLGSLAERGYGFAYRVLDARHFGVPQRRRRVVIVGHLGDTGAAPAQVLLEPQGLPRNPAESIQPGPRPAAHAGHSAAGRQHPELIGFAWQAGGKNDASGTFLTDETPTLPRSQTLAIAYAADQTSTLQAAGGERGYRIDAEAAAGGHLVAFSENQRGELVASTSMPALNTGGGKPGRGYPAVMDGVVVRRLTPTECERLQGFPDHWTAGQPDSHRYKQLGNSVAVPVFEWVARRLSAIDKTVRPAIGAAA